ncbi:calcium/sodium antiporter [Legionella gresilensis]|uniref:calcium/sodium antiporter n=1 Tax=Legionella gresilensis TaxID=91823 RepID=UPI0010418763|nr:calcium/sodium antiporter [Legionella gresilensis]
MLAFLALVVGLIILGISADRFIEGAAAIAYHSKVSPLVIGMIIVGFGTSAPEMVVSTLAALQGHPSLAIGNALGSNIANIGLILGLTAIIVPMEVNSNIIRKQLPLLIIISLLMGFIFWDKTLTRPESIGLLLSFILVVIWTIYASLKNKADVLAKEVNTELSLHVMSLKKAILLLLFGLILLILSSKLVVWGAVHIAKMFGVSDLIIGLTVLASGTSLPELAASIIAARKNEPDMAIGNIIGSNMFNLLSVIGIAGLITPITAMPKEILFRDWPVMMAMTTGLFLMAYGLIGKGRITRWEGGILLTIFIFYYVFLIRDVVLA